MVEVVHELTRSHIQSLAEMGKRIDGRGLEEHRPLTVEKGYIDSAEGSARVHLGATDVLVGVKMELGSPYDDRPESGVLITVAELRPGASPTFELGPPKPPAIELARVVDRGIRSAGAVDVTKLGIEPGEKVWLLFVDIHILDYEGNLFDAASYAALAALMHTTIPRTAKLGEGKDEPLEVEHQPISVTAAKIGDAIFIDPSLEEERIADARLTVVTDEKGHIRAMQKGLTGRFTVDEVEQVVSLSQKIGKEIRKMIAEA